MSKTSNAGEYRGCQWIKLENYGYVLLGGPNEQRFVTLAALKRYVRENCVWSGHHSTDRNNWGG